MSLSQLYQSSKTTGATSKAASHRKSRASAWWLPVFLVVSFAGLFAFVFRDRLLPAMEVEVVRAVLLADIGVVGTDPQSGVADRSTPSPKPGGLPDFSGAMLFQAAGWLEPDPLPIRATALTDGVIENVHVLEGQKVTRGELIAELIEEDAELALRAADTGAGGGDGGTSYASGADPLGRGGSGGDLGSDQGGESAPYRIERYRSEAGKPFEGNRIGRELIRARQAVQVQEAEIDAQGSMHRGALAKLKAIEAQTRCLKRRSRRLR